MTSLHKSQALPSTPKNLGKQLRYSWPKLCFQGRHFTCSLSSLCFVHFPLARAARADHCFLINGFQSINGNMLVLIDESLLWTKQGADEPNKCCRGNKPLDYHDVLLYSSERLLIYSQKEVPQILGFHYELHFCRFVYLGPLLGHKSEGSAAWDHLREMENWVGLDLLGPAGLRLDHLQLVISDSTFHRISATFRYVSWDLLVWLDD